MHSVGEKRLHIADSLPKRVDGSDGELAQVGLELGEGQEAFMIREEAISQDVATRGRRTPGEIWISQGSISEIGGAIRLAIPITIEDVAHDKFPG